MGEAQAQATITDADAVGRVLGGDTNAYAIIVARYHGRCLRYAERVLRNRADAEDAVQETFLKAYDALGRYEERSRFAAWLFRILVNQCRAAAARRGLRERWVTADETAVLHAPAGEGAYGAGGADVPLELVEQALAELEPLLREAFLLRHVEGLDYNEMQAVTGAGLSALKMRVKRACDALRGRLEGVYDA
jgi:RNA polymerase sigma-70 factor, ECF subfamily